MIYDADLDHGMKIRIDRQTELNRDSKLPVLAQKNIDSDHSAKNPCQKPIQEKMRAN